MRPNAQAAPAQLIDPLAQFPNSLQASRRPEPMELATLVERALAAAAPLPGPVQWNAPAPGDAPAPACALAVDCERLQCALTMLIRAAQSQGRAVRLDTHLDAAGAEIRVQATGPAPGGLGPIVSDSVRSAAMVQEQVAAAGALVQSQGGHLLFRWAGAGNPFMLLIRLPIERTLAPLPGVRREQRHGRRPSVRQRLDGIHVLLVEDDPDALEFLTLILRQTGAQVSPFGLAQPAYDFFVATARKPDIVVSDIAMPDQDGYGLLHKLRHWERVAGRAGIPALAVSAFARIEDVRRCIAAGFDRHLAKPVEAGRILDEIGSWFPAVR